MEVGQVIHGFELVSVSNLEEAASKALIFKHKKTGARLLKLENSDDNKVFGIGFRTPPEDSTGVAHIVEHCVLSGSRKFKTKEPFMDMYKGSLQTFLNAMTYPDKTIYPIASRNKNDFRNLMDVYLDAVFYPAIGEKPQIFAQEGWHYELFEKDKDIVYKGVVYNEMKGAMSASEDQVDEFLNQALYPDSIYGNNSGGDPYDIPKLTYENFLAFHKKYYHPSNSYIFLYGDGDTGEELEFIEGYLKDFDYLEVDSKIKDQELFKEKCYREFEYSTDEVLEGKKDYLAYSVLTGDISDGLSTMINNILKDALVDSDAGPIKEAIMEKGLGEDVYSMGYSLKQMPFHIVLKNTSVEKKAEFENLIDGVLRDIIEKGIDKDLILSSINRFEYALREASGFPTRGIIYFIVAFESWLYDQSPLDALSFNQSLKDLKEGLDKGLFEKFIEEKILNNPHKVITSVSPKFEKNKERDKKVAEELADYKKSLSDEEIERLIKFNKELELMQTSEDSEEAKATIPCLSRSEIKTELERIDRNVIDGKAKYIYHDLFTAGISYFDIFFDYSHIDVKDAPYISLLAEMLTSVDTQKRSYQELTKKIYLATGGINFSPLIFQDKTDREKLYFKFSLFSKTLSKDFKSIMDLIRDITKSSIFSDKKRIHDIIKESKSKYEMGIFNRGSKFVASRLESYFSKRAKYDELLCGLDYFHFIQDLDKEFEEKADFHIEKLKEVYSKIFNGKNILVNFTGDGDSFESFKAEFEDLITSYDSFEKAKDLDLTLDQTNEGISSSSAVQYVAKGARLEDTGYEYSGKMVVLSSIISRNYLHNNVRAKGGAYGVNLSISRDSIVASSYRDPNLETTLDAYDGIAKHLRELELTDRELDSYIIGAMSAFDPAMSAYQKGIVDFTRFLTGRTVEEKEKELEEALSIEAKDLKNFAAMLEKAMDKNLICVLGSKEKIENAKGLFNSIITLNK